MIKHGAGDDTAMDDAPTGSVPVFGQAVSNPRAPAALQTEPEPIMPLPRLARWSSVLLLTTSLVTLSVVPARADDTTLWDTVKLRTQQVFALGADTAHALSAWVSGLGGESRLAEDLLAFSNKDLRDLELLVDSAGYKLEDITIHRGAHAVGDADVTLGFTYQRAVDARHKSELREIIARDNALVDEDTRTIVGALLDATQRVQAAPPERFQSHRIQIHLGQPPEVAFDFRAQGPGAERAAPPRHQTGIAGLMPTMVSSAAAATPAAAALTATAVVVPGEPARARLAASDVEGDPAPPPPLPEAAAVPAAALAPAVVKPVAAEPAPPPAPAAAAPAKPPEAAPEAKPAAAPAPLPAEPAKAVDAVPEAKPPADIVGAPEAAKPESVTAEPPKATAPEAAATPEPAKPVEPAAAEPAKPAPAEAAKPAAPLEPAVTPAPAQPAAPSAPAPEPAPEPAKPEPGKSSAAPATFQVADAAEPAAVAKPEPAPAPEPAKAEAPKPAEPVAAAKPEPTPAPEPAKAEAPKPAEPVAAAKPEPAPAPEPVEAEAPKPAVPVAAAKPATYRVTLTHTNGHAGPSKDAAKLRAVSPKDVLVKTGKSQGKWFEFVVNGETGPTSKVWIYETVVTEIK